jgi:hypothetical protein
MSTDCDWEKKAVAHLVGIRAQPDVINSGALDLLRRMDGLIRHLIYADIEHRVERLETNLH